MRFTDRRQTTVHCLATVGICAICACGNSNRTTHGSDGMGGASQRALVAEGNGRRDNPFTSSHATTSIGQNPVGASLRIDLSSGDDLLHGGIQLTNLTSATLAVMTAPIETRLQLRPEDSWPWEGMASPYARLYIFRAARGMPPWRGDAGAEIRGVPGFVVLNP